MFRARYDGSCAFCDAGIAAGERMGLASGESSSGYDVDRAPACVDCATELGDVSARSHDSSTPVASTPSMTGAGVYTPAIDGDTPPEAMPREKRDLVYFVRGWRGCCTANGLAIPHWAIAGTAV
jgi:hypothetical protein